ncbi:hypothetical protein CSQ85_12810 [Bifidobacterium rousetti]|uniref:hypothetical protein n=1 Tax=Bifidobacterium rousetti TaxID=2045439 RepID=UPI00123B71EA|nr:hypothetical protein [Bifidobacterium rousetti]KAA8815255.1 hypothetical protein CSQ85_12810 [Bifidobacterium rousetti]
MTAATTGERLRLRFRLADGEWDVFHRGDDGHAGSGEHPALYLIHRPRKPIRGLAADWLDGIEITPDGTEGESFSTCEPFMRQAVDPATPGHDTVVPYQQALTILTRHHQ